MRTFHKNIRNKYRLYNRIEQANNNVVIALQIFSFNPHKYPKSSYKHYLPSPDKKTEVQISYRAHRDGLSECVDYITSTVNNGAEWQPKPHLIKHFYFFK